jgi:dienelactone hydrolase
MAKILVLHGDADPLVPLSEINAFVNEMRAAKADWEINTYANAKHSFTGEGVAGKPSPEAGLHPQSEQRSWQATLQFLEEVLA